MSHAGQEVEFRRDCDVVEIPAGHPLRVTRGTRAVITQSLGGTFTLRVAPSGALVHLPGAEADAIGVEPPVESAKVGGGDLETQVWELLKTCFDPEIPVNIVDLGLVYDMRISDAARGKRVDVKMTLTAPGCGMGATIAADAQNRLEALPGVEEANVEIVWEPPWGPQMISPEGRQKLGID